MTSPVALVTGGGGGIGSAISRRLASDGMRVLVGYRASVDRADRVVSELTGEGHRALQVPVDDSEALAAVAMSWYYAGYYTSQYVQRTQDEGR